MARPRLTRHALPLLLLTIVWPLALPGAARAQEPSEEAVEVVVLVLVDRISFEDALAVPEIAQLAGSGGASLMSVRTASPHPRSAYRAIGAGSLSADADPGAMAAALQARGVTVCPIGSGSSVGAYFRPELELAGIGPGPLGFVCGGSESLRPDPLSPGGLRTDPEPIMELVADVAAGLDRSGSPVLFLVNLGDPLRVDREAPYATPRSTMEARRSALVDAGALLRGILRTLDDAQTLALVVTPSTSFGMDLIGDEVTPVAMARGPAGGLLSPAAEPRSLRSASTRLDGLVANVDVAPTVLDAFGLPIPDEMSGLPMEFTGGPAPFDLHDRHVEQRRIRVPVQVAAVSIVSLFGLVIIGVMAMLGWGKRTSPAALGATRFLALCGMAAVIALLAGGSLPRLTYPVVVPFLAVAASGLAALSLVARRRGPLGPLLFMGLLGGAFVALDVALGSPALRLPLLGGTALDGGRFYGLPNAFIATLLTGAVFVASRTTPSRGFALLLAAGLLAGLPGSGANVGASITLFGAAGVWWVLRTREALGLRELAFIGGVIALGLAVVLLANRWAPGTPTHAAQFVEETDGLRAFLETVRRRLAVGVRQVAQAPVALLPLVALPGLLWLSLRPPPAIERGLRVGRAWRDVMITLTVAGILAFVANDTGVAAAGPGFIYALAAMSYPTLLPPGDE